jgi:uncharacterized protein YeaO (DUF488 family)
VAPELAPSAALVKRGLAADDERTWASFARAYRKEMKAPGAVHLIDMLAALSSATGIAVGCYCADESRCHRSILRELLAERGADIVD